MAFRSKQPRLVEMYRKMLKLAPDTSSELYHEGLQRSGAGHRAAFWDGYNGVSPSPHIIPGTFSAACAAAGRDFRSAQDKAGVPAVPQGKRYPLRSARVATNGRARAGAAHASAQAIPGAEQMPAGAAPSPVAYLHAVEAVGAQENPNGIRQALSFSATSFPLGIDGSFASAGVRPLVYGDVSIEDARAMGEKGGPAVESERLAFEAWMQGHCWELGATWNGTSYVSNLEAASGGSYVCPVAMGTRRMWAAWRDRAALGYVGGKR